MHYIVIWIPYLDRRQMILIRYVLGNWNVRDTEKRRSKKVRFLFGREPTKKKGEGKRNNLTNHSVLSSTRRKVSFTTREEK